MNRTKQNRAYYPRYPNSKAPKKIYTGDLFAIPAVTAPDPKTLPLPPMEWFRVSEQS